jgi:hypothetical protein
MKLRPLQDRIIVQRGKEEEKTKVGELIQKVSDHSAFSRRQIKFVLWQIKPLDKPFRSRKIRLNCQRPNIAYAPVIQFCISAMMHVGECAAGSQKM